MILTVTLNPSIDKLYLLERLEARTVMRVLEVLNTAGGKGLNVSRVAALAGEPVTAMGLAGGYNGRLLESLIDQPLIRPAFTRTRSETRCCVNVWETGLGQSTEFLEPGQPISAAEADAFFADFSRELPQADAVTLSGSLPPGMPEDSYARLITACREAGIPALLDSSGQTLADSLKAGPSLIKPNLDELKLLGYAGEAETDLLRAAWALHQQGVPQVVISRGAKGALLVCREGAFRAVPPAITPVNTVSCGDSMLAGFALGLARGWPIREGLRYATAVSAAKALSRRAGDYQEADLARMLGAVRIEQIREDEP